ncbi:MAG: sulfurtransferase [Bacteroidota bacterium]
MRLLLALAFIGFAGCATAPASLQATTETPLLISAEALVQRLGEDNLVVIHVVRDADTFDDGHIPGARLLSFSAIATERNGAPNVLPDLEAVQSSFEAIGVSDDSHVVLYGDMGGLAAARALYALDEIGHPTTSVLDGGLEAWRRAGGDVSTDAVEIVERGAMTFRPRLTVTARAEEMFELLGYAEAGGAVIVDARPYAHYTGETPGGGVERPGHIPPAVSLYWQEDLQPDGTLRPLAELQERYAAAGATPGTSVVAYCRTGVQASHTYLVARLLGLNPRLYDGSYFEWSNQTDYPVEAGP